MNNLKRCRTCRNAYEINSKTIHVMSCLCDYFKNQLCNVTDMQSLWKSIKNKFVANASPIGCTPLWRNHFSPVSCCGRASSETLLRFFCPKTLSSVHPILSLRTEGVFRGSFSPRAQNRCGFLILRHESGPEFYWKLARTLSHILLRILSRILFRNRPEFFGPLFSLPPKNHAKSTPPSGPKTTPILETFLSVVSLGARHWSAALLLEVSMSMLTNEDL